MTDQATTYRGQKALDRMAELWALHDGVVRRVVVAADTAGDVSIELQCVPRPESPAGRLVLRFEGVSGWDLSWHGEDEFLLVPAYTAFIEADGYVRMSLDPFDDTGTEADERDCCVIEAKQFLAEVTLKS